MKHSIRQRLLELRETGRSAFIPFIMAGDPSLEYTPQVLRSLVKAGADIIEVGVPFSDPIADGPVNQAAAERALAAGTSLKGILDMLNTMQQEQPHPVPLVLFSYANPILRIGLNEFAQKAQAAGVAGVLLVDMPPEESEEMAQILCQHELEWVSLASPTTPPERLSLLGQRATGCLYYVARAGVTGTQSELSDHLAQELAQVRQAIDVPLVVGFGISKPEHVQTLAPLCDGIVVGSALVKCQAEASSPEAGIQALEQRVRELCHPLKTQSQLSPEAAWENEGAQ